MAREPVRIIGAGIGGLTLARCLLHHGIPAVVYEKRTSSSRPSYGVTLHSSAYKPLLGILGLDEWAFRRRVAVDSWVGGIGTIEPKSLICPKKIDPSSFRAHRDKLEKLLRQGVDVQWEYALDKVEPTSTGPLLSMQNGQKIESSCCIGADGPHSNTRKSLLPNTPLKVLSYVVFNGKRHVARAEFDSIYAPGMGTSNVVEIRQSDVVFNVSVNEKQADFVSIGWIYSRPARAPSDLLHKPNRPVSRAADIPEEFFAEVGGVSGLPQPFKTVFDAVRLRDERVLHWLMRTVLVDHHDLLQLATKGMFFMGDSVHAEPILGGEGANNAIINGIKLASRISTSGTEGIASWYESRYSAWASGVAESEESIAQMHDAHKPVV